MLFSYYYIPIISTLSSVQSYTVGCPNNLSFCTYNNIQYLITNPNAPVCWTKQTYGWSCFPRNESDCNDYNTIDITKCNYNKSNNNYCPTSIDSCDYNGVSYSVTNPSAPPCWNDFNGEWNCAYKQANGQCNPSIFYVDITQCHYNPPPPPPPNNKYCPTSIDRCTNGGLSWLVTDPSAPPCWNNSNGAWNCAYKQANGQCNPSIFYVDITQCHYNTPPPVCYNNICSPSASNSTSS